MSNLKFYSLFATSFLLLGGGITYFLLSGSKSSVNVPETKNTKENILRGPVDAANDSYKLTSQKGYNLIKPLLQTNQVTEAKEYQPLRAEIQNVIDDDKRLGLLSSATIYLYSFTDGKWLYINPSEMYNPGSMLKVPMLITYLKESETNPSLLNKKIVFNDDGKVPNQTYASQSIQRGNAYSVKDLLHYMIAYSDNNATKILNNNVVLDDFYKTFADLNMPQPSIMDHNYQMPAKDISDFFVILYYATYISRANSEYAMEMLSDCDFKDGMVKGIPQSTKIAHKFGEWGDNRSGIHEMHETGVIYLANKPYLLTVMTKGDNSKDLGNTISKISKVVYDNFSAGVAM